MTDYKHPDAVLEQMLKHGGHSDAKQVRLCAVHDVARTRFNNGERNFQPDVMGKALAAAGVMAYTSYAGSTSPVYRLLGKAWQDYADDVDLGLNHDAPEGHPDAVLVQLLADPKRRGNAAASLRAVHKTCKDRFNRNELNFSVAAVARDTEAAGTVAEGAIRGGIKRGYGELLEAWQRLSDEREARVDEAASEHGEGDEEVSEGARKAIPPRYRQSAATDQKDDPDTVLARLLRERNLKRSTAEVLQQMQWVCRARFDRGELDFSRSGCARDFVKEKVFASDKTLVYRLSATPRYSELLDAWQAKADLTWIDFSPDLAPTHPHLVFRRLREKFRRSDKQETLLHIHRICHEEHAAGHLNFEVKTVGKLLEERGILAAKSLFHSVYDDMRILLKAWDEYARPWAYGEGAPPASERTHSRRSHNPDFEWVRRDHPEFEAWRALAAEWVQLARGSIGARIATLNAFFKKYLTRDDVPKHPVDFLNRGTRLPDIMEVVAEDGATNWTNRNNQLFEFFQWVLLRDFGMEDDAGDLYVPVEFRNPLTRAKSDGGGQHDDSVRNSLPYGYVYRLRRLLAQGPNFQDWTFARNASGAEAGRTGRPSTHWFEVDRELIDPDDPDCVWRIRETTKGRVLYEMWSPVRWVALLVKLTLPARGGQVRMLDSGESDYWKLVAGEWVKNDHPLAAGSKERPWQQGVLRRDEDMTRRAVTTILFINTNKTADRNKEGPSKGYSLPWHTADDVTDNVFYWLEKLRNWQGKYNPIVRRSSWRELRAKHINPKTDGALKSYPDTCFLFRTPEASPTERALPVSDAALSYAWFHLLEALQEELAENGEVDAEGRPIVFVGRGEKGRQAFNHYSLHSLRVSLITALARDGGVPFEILRKLAGHTRLVMTLYYYKPGSTSIAEDLAQAAARMDANKQQSIQRFLRDTPHDRLEKEAIANSPQALRAVIPIHPADRNPAGWMLQHHGMCLVGGNTSPVEGNSKVGGCYNGGEPLGPKGSYGPVPGGIRNCVRCRWFVTEPHYLLALTDHFNNLAYHLDEAWNRSRNAERKWQDLLRRKAELEFAGELFTEHKTLGDAERLMEATAQAANERLLDILATINLIERCQAVLNAGTNEGGRQLVLQGEATQVMAMFESVDSELLQLSGVCDGLELYPELEAGKAVLRRSQLLDSALVNEGLPPMFMRLTEDEQLKVGNAFMQRLSRVVSPDQPFIGKREVVKIIDAGKKLGQSLGLNVSELLAGTRVGAKPTPLKLEAAEA